MTYATARARVQTVLESVTATVSGETIAIKRVHPDPPVGPPPELPCFVLFDGTLDPLYYPGQNERALYQLRARLFVGDVRVEKATAILRALRDATRVAMQPEISGATVSLNSTVNHVESLRWDATDFTEWPPASGALWITADLVIEMQTSTDL